MSYILNMPAPIISRTELKQHLLKFIVSNASIGVRNADCGRAIGYNDSRQWFSYGLLESMIKEGYIRKERVNDQTRYFPNAKSYTAPC